MHTENICGIHGERAIDENGQFGDIAVCIQLVERVDDLLGSADGEGGNDHLAALFGGPVHHVAQLAPRSFVGAVEAVAVGALHNHDVGCLDDFGRVEDGDLVAAEVAAEHEPPLLAGNLLADF